MTRRAAVNAALLVAVVILALGAWLLPRGRSGPAPLTALEPDEVRAFTLHVPGQDAAPGTRLERRRDGWHVTEPIERPARDGRVVTALDILGRRPESCYDVAGHTASDFGLASPRAVLAADGAEIAFGDRAADGRRYVRSGERFCLVPDRSYALFAAGLDGLATTALLRAGAVPVRIETPAARAARANPALPWEMQHGDGDPEAWAARWRAASAGGFLLDPPAADLGRVRVTTGDGSTRAWRIARREPDTVLVPDEADYGLVIPAERARALLEPPAVEDGQD